MNYKEFIEKVDKRLSDMSEDEKAKLIHNFARVTKQEDRKKFFEFMQSNYVDEKYEVEIKEINEWCQKIKDRKVYFECTGDEVYNDYYHGQWVYEYVDEYKIGETIENILQIAEKLVYQKKYKQAYELYETICMMSYSALDTDCEEFSELQFMELFEEELIDVDIRNISLHLLYSKYQSTNPIKCAKEIYELFKFDMFSEIHIDEFFSVGPEEIINVDGFIEQWIQYLKNKDEELAAKLLADILLSYDDIEKLSEVAKETIKVHPSIYLVYCEKLFDKGEYGKIVELGKMAIELIDIKLKIRSDILNIAVAAAEIIGDRLSKSIFAMEAFYSNSNVINYIKLFDTDNYEENVSKGAEYIKNIINPHYRKNVYNFEKQENSISLDTKNIICFFNMQFENIQEKCNKDKNWLGWSNSFKGIAIPLFLLMLDKRNYYSKAGRKLIIGIQYKILFNRKNYERSFEEYFLIWKENLKISNEKYEEYISWCEKQVKGRVDAITGGNYRGSYYKAAELIVQMGEVLEANGKTNGKMLTVEYYKKLNSRKSAFKAEIDELI